MVELLLKDRGGLPPIPQRPFILGLDIGKYNDPSALALVQRVDSFGPRDPVTMTCPHSWALHVRALKRFPLGRPYPALARDISAIFGHADLHGRSALVVDATGVGEPVVDLIREQLRDTQRRVSLVPVVITSGGAVTWSAGRAHVPRADILASLNLFFQLDRLLIPNAEPAAPQLRRELLRFQSRPQPNGPGTMTARHGEHDDLLFALALAAWHATREWPHR